MFNNSRLNSSTRLSPAALPQLCSLESLAGAALAGFLQVPPSRTGRGRARLVCAAAVLGARALRSGGFPLCPGEQSRAGERGKIAPLALGIWRLKACGQFSPCHWASGENSESPPWHSTAVNLGGASDC